MPPAVELVVADLRQREIAAIDFEHDLAREGQQERGRHLVVGEHDFGAEHAHIPVFQGSGVARRQTQMFHTKIHAPWLADPRAWRTRFFHNVTLPAHPSDLIESAPNGEFFACRFTGSLNWAGRGAF